MQKHKIMMIFFAMSCCVARNLRTDVFHENPSGRIFSMKIASNNLDTLKVAHRLFMVMLTHNSNIM